MGTLVEIKQAPDLGAQMLGLDKYDKSKFPGTFEIMQAGRGTDNRWITGIDEDAVSLKRINDIVLREELRAEKKALREELERLTGHDLSATSDFWLNFYIKIIDQLALNFDVPLDRVKYHVLLANHFSAPELEAKTNPDFINSKFYMHRSDTEDNQKAVKTRERDKAVSDLFLMYDNEPKLKLIGRYVIGTKVKDSMGKDGVYNILRDAITNDKEGTVVRKFAEATSRTIEELQYKLIIDEAVQRHVIRIREGYYQRGNATYGKTMKDVMKFLSSPENANEFQSIKEEVEEKRSLG